MTDIPREVVQAMGAEPTAEQWRAISMPLEPYVIVAGAGSGKTSVMAARVVYLALAALGRVDAAGVLPGNVLCLTFTTKATENLVARVRRALAAVELPEGEEPTVLNYHGFAAQVLDRHGLLAGLEPGQRVLSPAQRTELCARVLDGMTFEHVRAEWQPSLVDAILTLDDQMANHRRTPAEVIAFDRARIAELEGKHKTDKLVTSSRERVELARAVEAFQGLKAELGVIDFGDQITKALAVAEAFPEVMAADYGSRFQAVLLDEYQDTNVAQADLIAAVFGHGFPVTAVGDPDQNIYAWRGASLFNLLQFQERFRKAGGSPSAKLPLYTNFRSGRRILAAADTVIAPVPNEQRPDPDKRLDPFPPNGEGHVEVRRFTDEWAEAQWIASEVRRLHDEAPEERPWSSFAVLCRKTRLFTPMQQAFVGVEVPIEVVGLAGLLKMPEVVEVLAYARAVAEPDAGVAIARILLGPRYRVGFKDLARVGAWAKGRNRAMREEDPGEEAPAFLFSEAVEHLEEVEHLSDEGRARLEEFQDEVAALRVEARRPVGEFLAEVMRRTGLLAELDASLDLDRAASAKRNLAAFLDQVHAFSPLEGELTLRGFLQYVDTVQGAERQEWAPVQPSGENSVKVMTVHQAKGLEFDHVFVPGVAEGLLPDLTIQHNPVERGKSLDFELRGDHEILPSFVGLQRNLAEFKRRLKEQELIEERRTCYVALTRARRRLVVSGAHWYGDDVIYPKKPSQFLDELAAWGTDSAEATVDVEVEPGQENPMAGYRQAFVKEWPGPAVPVEADELFPEGWRAGAAAVRRAGSDGSSLAVSLDPSESERYASVSTELRTLALHLGERDREAPPAPVLPTSIAVGGIVEYARCPKRFYWSHVRPLPRFSGPAARIGTQVHVWIERQASGQTTLLDLEEQPDLGVEELEALAGEPGRIERLQDAFRRSRFAGAVPLYAERPFVLRLDGFTVSGRIDAVFARPDGGWEVVDYKTGRKPADDDELAGLQLDLYAIACVEVFGKRPEDLTLTYLYLGEGDGVEVSRPAGDLDAVRARVVASLRAMTAGEFSPTPGAWCRWCDFLSFCDAGRAHLRP